MNTLKRFARDETGAILVEFLIVMPVLLLMVVATFHLGYYVMYYHSIEKAARNGARYLARVPPDAIGGWADPIAKNLMLYGATSPTGLQPLLPGWTDTTTISITKASKVHPASTVESPRPNYVIVRVGATVPLDLPVLSFFGFDEAFDIGAAHQERNIGE